MSQRIECIDIAKGIGIILVIAGHTFSLKYSSPIYVFHMPLFFFLSGMVYKEHDQTFWDFIKDKANKILRPWFILYLISLGLCLVIPQWLGGVNIKGLLRDLYTAEAITVHNSSLWYLVCYFIVTLLFYWINKLERTRLIVACLWIIAVGLLFLLPQQTVRLPFKADTAMVAVVFFAVAVWSRSIIQQTVGCKLSFTLVMLSVVSLGCLCNCAGWCNISSLSFGNYTILYYPLVLFCIFSIIFLSRWISVSGNDYIRKFFSYYGRNSLVVFGFQGLLIRLYLLFFNEVSGLSMGYCLDNPIEHQIGSFVVVTLLLSPIVVEFFARLRKLGYKIL